MRHVINLAVKFVLLALMLGILLPNISPANTGQAITIAVILTLLAYVIGDLYILKYFGNISATIADFFLAAFIIWGAQYFMPGVQVSIVSAMIVAAFIALGEWFFHNYIRAAEKV